jgi:AraC-like DNA-binding protein
MIIGYISDPFVRAALLRAGHPEEDVILDPRLAEEALAFGYARLVVYAQAEGGYPYVLRAERVPPVLTLSSTLRARWEEERRSDPRAPAPIEWMTMRIREMVGREAWEVSWVDRALSDLGRAAGMPLPPMLRAVGRRVMEFPSHYDDLHPLAEACGLSRGALKARFRRRGLPSPYAYLRWFRVMAVAHALSDRAVTVAQVASRLGYTSDGNLCRSMLSLTRLTPTEARTLHGWNRLLINFAWTHLDAGALEAWRAMDDLFVARVA